MSIDRGLRAHICEMALSLANRARAIPTDELERVEALLVDAINGTFEGPGTDCAAKYYRDDAPERTERRNR